MCVWVFLWVACSLCTVYRVYSMRRLNTPISANSKTFIALNVSVSICVCVWVCVAAIRRLDTHSDVPMYALALVYVATATSIYTHVSMPPKNIHKFDLLLFIHIDTIHKPIHHIGTHTSSRNAICVVFHMSFSLRRVFLFFSSLSFFASTTVCLHWGKNVFAHKTSNGYCGKIICVWNCMGLCGAVGQA